MLRPRRWSRFKQLVLTDQREYNDRGWLLYLESATFIAFWLLFDFTSDLADLPVAVTITFRLGRLTQSTLITPKTMNRYERCDCKRT